MSPAWLAFVTGDHAQDLKLCSGILLRLSGIRDVLAAHLDQTGALLSAVLPAELTGLNLCASVFRRQYTCTTVVLCS